MPKCPKSQESNTPPRPTHTYTHLLLLPSLPLNVRFQSCTASQFRSTGLKDTRLKICVKWCFHTTHLRVMQRWSEVADVTSVLRSAINQRWGFTKGRLSLSTSCGLIYIQFAGAEIALVQLHALCDASSAPWGGVVPEMLSFSFSCRETQSQRKPGQDSFIWAEGASQGGSWGIHQAAVTWLSGGERWEFISGQQIKTSHSLNLQTPPNTTQVRRRTMFWHTMPLASVQHGPAVSETTDSQSNYSEFLEGPTATLVQGVHPLKCDQTYTTSPYSLVLHLTA